MAPIVRTCDESFTGQTANTDFVKGMADVEDRARLAFFRSMPDVFTVEPDPEPDPVTPDPDPVPEAPADPPKVDLVKAPKPEPEAPRPRRQRRPRTDKAEA